MTDQATLAVRRRRATRTVEPSKWPPVALTGLLGVYGARKMLTDVELQTLRNMGNEAEAAADEIVDLRSEIALLESWEREGEAIFEPYTKHVTSMFSLGAWWADRPWRKR